MDNYEDIINLPYKKSTRKKHMSLRDRAAQFGSFAALKGHDEAIEETARLTDKKPDIDEYEIEKINNTLLEILQNISEEPKIVLTYFIPDDKKEGGMCVTIGGQAVKIKEFEKELILKDKRIVPIEEILDIKIIK
ncbi:MAG: hypothetical protein E7394_04855 [Ruminococcaceae bacterium]|nr:hypothetical protein [Oscillospiraceae bacterium]